MNGLFLTKMPFAEKIIDLTGLTNAKTLDSTLPLSLPLDNEKPALTDKDLTSMQDISFREVLGSLLFLETRASGPGYCNLNDGQVTAGPVGLVLEGYEVCGSLLFWYLRPCHFLPIRTGGD